jgi:uncharacterized protein with ParB-like and HNH nuclease domain
MIRQLRHHDGVTVEANPVRIIQYFDGAKQSVIPLFQRPYTWDKEKWSVLWDDIMNHYGSDEKTSHFMGAVVSIPVKTVPVGVTKHLVIDGQQRLTTLAIILTVLRDCVDTKTADRIDDYLVNRHYDGPDRLKLLPTQGDRDVYKLLVLDRAVSTNASRVRGAYEYFRERLKENHDFAPIDLLLFLETIEQSLQVVMINLGDTDDPYLIFESLNAKGEPLTQADLVRNYVLMKFRQSLEPGGDQERIYEQYWNPLQQTLGLELTDFLRHYCMKDGTTVEKRTVYTAIKRLIAGKADNAGIEAELKDMKRLGEYYSRFIDASKEPDPEIRTRLAAFVELDVTTGYPLLLRLFDSRDRQTITDGDLKKCLFLIESFVVRRAICAVPTNSLGKMFLQWSKDYRETGVVTWLHGKLSAGSGNARWPTDTMFKTAFETSEQYGRKATRHVLTCLEKNFGHKEIVKLENTTIEHVMPQDLSPAWEEMLGTAAKELHESLLHTFGNLTLSAYNSELGNLPFSEKRKMLQDSHIDLNIWIAGQSEWNEQTIIGRAVMLGDTAAKLWVGPEIVL